VHRRGVRAAQHRILQGRRMPVAARTAAVVFGSDHRTTHGARVGAVFDIASCPFSVNQCAERRVWSICFLRRTVPAAWRAWSKDQVYGLPTDRRGVEDRVAGKSAGDVLPSLGSCPAAYTDGPKDGP